MTNQRTSKPFDLRAADLISDRQGYRWDKRTYECTLCGKRLGERELDEGTGLCPNDGNSMRPLNSYERKHPKRRLGLSRSV